MRYIPNDYQQTFYQQVWSQVRKVPYSKVATYGQIAQLLLPPKGITVKDYQAFSARWVGDAMADCPKDVPWQRIVNAKGQISKRVDADKQKRLLEAEGVVFIEEALDLKCHQWEVTMDENESGQASLF